MPRTSSARSTGLGSSAWRRAKASRRWVSDAPRSARPAWRRRSGGRSRDRRGRRLRSSSRLPSTAVSRLLKSCATPPVSWPIDSSFCRWRSCSSVRSRSAIERQQLVMGMLQLGGALVAPAARAGRSSAAGAARPRAGSRAVRASRTGGGGPSWWRARRCCSVVGWNGRSMKRDVARAPRASAPAIGLRSGPPPWSVTSTNGRSDQAGCAASHADQWREVGGADRLLGQQHEAGVVVDRGNKCGQIAADIAVDAAPRAAIAPRRRRVAPARRQDQRAQSRQGRPRVTLGFASGAPRDRRQDRRNAAQHALEVDQRLADVQAARRSGIRGSCPRARRCAS